MLSDLRELVEVDVCNESKSVLTLKGNDIRLLQKHNLKEDPIFIFDDTLVYSNYPQMSTQLSLMDMRYNWGLMRVFNKYLIQAVHFINMSDSVPFIPKHSIPFTMASILSTARTLCLSSLKAELRHSVLEETALYREQCPDLFFERLKMAHEED